MGTVTVGDVQARLNALGANPPLTTDGAMGPMTQGAIKTFQSSHGLAVDGVVGPMTLSALGFSGITSMVPGVPSGAHTSNGSGASVVSTVNSLVDQAVQILIPVTGLYDTVIKAWAKFNTPNEGYLDYMYTDAIGLVTTGMGNLIDSDKGWTPAEGAKVAHTGVNPPAAALALPWLHRSSGAPASSSEIASAWSQVKAAWPGRSSTGCAGMTDLYLEKTAIDTLIQAKLEANQDVLLKMFPSMASWPADAQMAIHSMGWAMGTGDPNNPNSGIASFKQLRTALCASPPDFATAANQCHMQGVGIDQRNNENKQMFLNAADVQAKGADPSNIYFPGAVVVGIVAAAGGLVGGIIACGAAFVAWKLGWLDFLL